MKDLNRQEKRTTRYICLQLLFASEISNEHKKDDLLDNFFQKCSEPLVENIKKSQIDYIEKLYETTISNKDEVDKIIEKKLNNWEMKRIAVIDKVILRMSISEMLYIDEVPPKVSITEGVEIAKIFSTDDSSGFVNGILDSVYNKIYKK
tara:strand:+ start:3938 stop:4384 length:447 start_codon:yes stop_codon:yes gene_type:complete